jgi:hypothetical protein
MEYFVRVVCWYVVLFAEAKVRRGVSHSESQPPLHEACVMRSTPLLAWYGLVGLVSRGGSCRIFSASVVHWRVVDLLELWDGAT